MNENLIYDVGACEGEDTQYYLEKGYQVLAIEANPHLCAALRDGLLEFVMNKQLEILNVAISSKTEPVIFWINQQDVQWSSTDPKVGARKGRAIPVVVPGVNFEYVLHTWGIPYYMKLDIETSEHLCLDTLSSFEKPPFISVETHDPNTIYSLHDLGYQWFKLVNQRSNKRASGPFGEDLGGLWTSYEQILIDWDRREKNTWYDTHARLL